MEENYVFFFFNDTATTEIYTLSLHDALPICMRGSSWVGLAGRHRGRRRRAGAGVARRRLRRQAGADLATFEDRKSTRLNSSHANISYAVFCLKKKKTNNQQQLISVCISHTPL